MYEGERGFPIRLLWRSQSIPTSDLLCVAASYIVSDRTASLSKEQNGMKRNGHVLCQSDLKRYYFTPSQVASAGTFFALREFVMLFRQETSISLRLSERCAYFEVKLLLVRRDEKVPLGKADPFPSQSIYAPSVS